MSFELNYFIFYRGYTEYFKLHSDDIKAIQLLYGKNKQNLNSEKKETSYRKFFNGTKKEPATNTQKSVNKSWTYSVIPDSNESLVNPLVMQVIEKSSSFTQMPLSTSFLLKLNLPTPETYLQKLIPANVNTQKSEANSICIDGKFDAISLLSDGFTYIFKNDLVYRMNLNFKMDKDYPKLINNVFRGLGRADYVKLPSNLDTVLYVPDSDMTFFFKENLYWRSSKLFELDIGYPRIISANFKGLNKNNFFNRKLDASFIWSGNKRAYFVEDNKYWRFDFVTGTVEHGYPKNISIWRGLSTKITSAMLWANGYTYFFSEDKYYRFNDLAFKIEESHLPYPRYNVDFWFNCNNSNRFGKSIDKY